MGQLACLHQWPNWAAKLKVSVGPMDGDSRNGLAEALNELKTPCQIRPSRMFLETWLRILRAPYTAMDEDHG